MKKFLIKLIVFLAILIVSIEAFVKLTDDKLIKLYGPNTEQQIRISFKNALKYDYDTLILGNSRIYRGINPNKLSQKAYNFAHDNDTFNQMYYKLKYVQEHDKLPDTLIMGVDYFQFSIFSGSRNYIYSSVMPKEYMKDYERDFNKEVNTILETKQNEFMLRLKSLNEKKDENAKVPYLKENGQYIRYRKAGPNETAKRNSEILPIQQEYFEKILEFCSENNIKVFMVMPPTRKNELASYTEEITNKFDEYFKSKENDQVFYLNYSKDERFKLEDYQDKTHLNIEGADKFSEILGDIKYE